MDILIVGAGVSGSYLGRELHSHTDHNVSVVDSRSKEKAGMDCAWGIPQDSLFISLLGTELVPDDYILHRSSQVTFGGVQIKLDDLTTFHKHRWILDMLEPISVEWKTKGREKHLPSYDLVIDATGPARALLPDIPEDQEWKVPCYQERVTWNTEPPFEDFYAEPKGAGYLWFFPLGPEEAWVGCGSHTHDQVKAVEEFNEEHGLETKFRTGGVVRGLPPSKSEPFFHISGTMILGVGESIGAISPLTGEGNSFSFETALILAKTLKKANNPEDVSLREIAECYRILGEEYNLDREHRVIRDLVEKNRLSFIWNALHMRPPRNMDMGPIDKLKLVKKGVNALWNVD